MLRGTDGQLTPASAAGDRRGQGRRPGAAAREPSTDGACHRAARRPRPRECGRRDQVRCWRHVEMPVGYTWEVGGQYDSQRKAFQELLLVSAVATALVFLVLVVQFRAFSSAADHPGRRAALALRRVCAAALHRHGPERVVGDGPDPAGRPGRQERHRAARLRRDATRRRAARWTRRSSRPRVSACGRS